MHDRHGGDFQVAAYVRTFTVKRLSTASITDHSLHSFHSFIQFMPPPLHTSYKAIRSDKEVLFRDS